MRFYSTEHAVYGPAGLTRGSSAQSASARRPPLISSIFELRPSSFVGVPKPRATLILAYNIDL